MAKASKNTQDQLVSKNPMRTELEKIEKDYGKGTILGKDVLRKDILSTGSLKLDRATGIGGCARGTVVEFMGWESCGKSTIASYLIADCQRQGLVAALIDGENAFDPQYAKVLGADNDPEKLVIYQADNGGGEKAYDIAERLIKTGKIGVIIFDSQTSLLPKKMFDDPAEASNIGLHARLLSRVVPKFVVLAGMYNVLVVFISQFREKIGVMYGNPETTNGGNALRMYCHMRFEFRRSVLRDGDKTAYANKTTVKVIKNKLANPFGVAEFHLTFGKGIDKCRELLDVAVDLGIITQAGSWYSYKETKLGQGEDGVIEMLRDNPSYAENLEKLIKVELINRQTNDNNDTGNSSEEVGGGGTEETNEGANLLNETIISDNNESSTDDFIIND